MNGHGNGIIITENSNPFGGSNHKGSSFLISPSNTNVGLYPSPLSHLDDLRYNAVTELDIFYRDIGIYTHIFIVFYLSHPLLFSHLKCCFFRV